MTKNPLTFKHISNNVVLPMGPPINASPAGNNEVHNAGEVWCVALWEVFVNLVAKHGHAEGEKRMLAYVDRRAQADAHPADVHPGARRDPRGRLGARCRRPDAGAGRLREARHGHGAVSPPSNSTSLAGVMESFTP